MDTLSVAQTQMAVLSANFTLVNVILFILGTIGYFVMEFKLKRGDKTFSIGFWIKDNWYNLVFSIVCVLAYFIIQKSVDSLTAFTLGLAPNLVADWAGTIISNMKKNNP